MNPIIDVAVKNAPNIQWPGRMPTSVSGIGAMMINGVTKFLNHATTRMYIRISTAAKATPRSLNTSYVICHSPSHFIAYVFSSHG